MRKLLAFLALTVVPTAFASPAVQADDAGQFDVRPAPAWVDRLEPDGRPSPASVRSGVDGLIDDHQIRVAGANVDDYFRRVRRVVTPAGVQNASELNIDFDPSYQRLVLHEIALIRDGRRIEQLDPAEVRIIEKEPESDDRIYDGQLTALVFLKDVRPGDVIDYSWTLAGSNPLFGGRYADEFDFGADVPTRRMRHRLLWPAGRPIHTSKPARVEHRGAEDVYTWERRDLPPTRTEDDTPEWFDPWETVQATEYGSWREVADWAVALFRVDDASRGAVARLAATIRAAHATRDEQIVAAIRSVQDDIRYLGIEMGRGSHEPRPPGFVLAQRYGDCKDKALLLAALLGELGVEAHPALVNTKLRRHLDRFLPSPFLFEHVITQVVDGGRTYWIDGTLSDQGGTLQTIDTPGDERALVVRAGTTSLTPVVVPNRGGIVVEELLATDRGRTTLSVTSTYSGRDADDMREHLASESLADVARDHLNRYAADHPRIAPLGAPAIDDDRTRNVLVLREQYAVRDLWENGSWTYRPRAIAQHLERPETLVRSMPLAVAFPLNVTERLIVRGGASPRVDDDDAVTDAPALHFEQHIRRGRDLVITTTLRTTADAVPVESVPDHLAALNEIGDASEVPLEPPHGGVLPWAIGLVAAVVVLSGTVHVYTRRKSLEPTEIRSFPYLLVRAWRDRSIASVSTATIKGDSGNA